MEKWNITSSFHFKHLIQFVPNNYSLEKLQATSKIFLCQVFQFKLKLKSAETQFLENAVKQKHVLISLFVTTQYLLAIKIDHIEIKTFVKILPISLKTKLHFLRAVCRHFHKMLFYIHHLFCNSTL